MRKLILKAFAAIMLLSCFSVAQVGISGTGGCVGVCTLEAPVVVVTTNSLPNGTQGSVYSPVTLAAVGGTAPYTWSVVAGSPPAGLTLSSLGVLSGTPTSLGTVMFSVVATDINGVASDPKQLSITIASSTALTILNVILPAGTVGSSYSQPIFVTGGTGTGYVCSLGGGTLPTGMTVSGTCATGLTASNITGAAGTYHPQLKVVDSGANSYTSPAYSLSIVAGGSSGPPNYPNAGLAIVNDSCVLQIAGAGASTPGCPATNGSLPNLHNGFSTCTQGTNCSAVDPQYNNILMTRCTDATLNGTITSGTFLNRTYEVGDGGSGDTNVFTTDASLLVVFDTGNRHYIETIDTINHTCYPLKDPVTPANPWLVTAGEFSSKTKGNFFSFFGSGSQAITKYVITCATPGNSGSPCTAPSSGTIAADFSTVFPGNTATQWTASTSYTYGQYVFTYLTNSQSSTVTAATCAGGIATYTVSPGLASLNTGQLFSVSGLSTFNGTALFATTANTPGTIITSNTGCSAGTATGTGTITEGSNVLFQNFTAGTHTSGGSAPTWNKGALFNTTDSGITWVNVGTTNFNQGGGWSTIGGVSVDETQFSAGFSNNNFDATAKGAGNGVTGVNMSGVQNTGFLVYTYNATSDIYSEWNTGTGIIKTFACTVSTGPQCTRGVGGITTVGQINVTSTVPCGSTPCQMYLHNIKIFKGGAFSTISPQYCLSAASGPGNCPTSSKYFWQPGTTTVNMATASDSGHQTERFSHYVNFGNAGTATAQIRTASASNTVSTMWTNSNISFNFDGHWGWYYLNGSVDDTTTSPIGGATQNTYDYPYTSPYEAEVLIVPSCGVSSGVTTPACSGSELQNSQVAREGHTHATGTNPAFNTQYGVGAFAQNGAVYGDSTDYACQFGSITGGTLYCGFPWSTSFAYGAGAMIVPTWPSTFKASNPGGFAYTTSGACTSGTKQPTLFNQTPGGTTTEATGTPCVWTNVGVANGRGDVVLYFLQ